MSAFILNHRSTITIDGMGIGTGHGLYIRPVSYTHLDVYKRQVQVSITTQETRTESVVHAKHVLNHQYLTVYVATGTDTDNRYGQFGCCLLCTSAR